MTETERLLRRQAEWQRQRQNLPWPEKIRQAEQLRGTLEAFRAQRRQHSAARAQRDGIPGIRKDDSLTLYTRAPSKEGEMSEQQNLEVVRSLYAAFGRGDLDEILAPLDPDVSWRTPGVPDLPTAGLRQGVSAVREFFGLLSSTFDIADFQPQDFLVAGDKVVVLGTSREGPKGSGRLVDFRWVHVFTFRNGRIVAFEEPADVSELVTEFRRSRAHA